MNLAERPRSNYALRQHGYYMSASSWAARVASGPRQKWQGRMVDTTQCAARHHRSTQRLRRVHMQVSATNPTTVSTIAATAAAVPMMTRLNSNSGMEYRRLGRSAFVGSQCQQPQCTAA